MSLASGGVVVDITDRDAGMASKELAYANWRLDDPPTTDIAIAPGQGRLAPARR